MADARPDALAVPARVRVLLLDGRLGPLDYAAPPGLALSPGDVVEVPLGPRGAVGVVWDGAPDAALDPRRLKPVARVLAVPALAAASRRLIDFVADYYLADPGRVARLALPAAALLAPPAQRVYRAGALPEEPLRPPARQALAEALVACADPSPATLAEWARRLGASPARLKPLVGAGLLVAADAAGSADMPAPSWRLPPGPALSPAQSTAAAALRSAVTDGGFQPFLLDGVTGSGKTEVYFEAIAAALDAGRQTLVLLPEIALTAPWLERFAARFGLAPTVWHSGVKPGERRRAFAALASGRAPVVVGARSAVFLPLPRLGLIVVDEAHEAAFKQEDGVFYHGRDVAVVRAREEAVPILLATATPGLETLENVARGRYRRLALPDRFGGARLPDVRLVDLRTTPPPRGRWIAPPLEDAIARALAGGEQALLFLNRRGYAPLTLCRTCGERIACPHCTAWMVDHRLHGRLVCHHCGHSQPRPGECPACGAADSLVACGPGVERLAEEVARLWPQARVAVVTSDTVRTPEDAARLQAQVRNHAVDLLIGTQMLAKGHDFPDLTVVGVIDADLGLEGGDLRAGEKSFQQVAQVAGRAGRAALPGRVFIQTHQPGAPLMQALARHDRDGFIAAERALREAAAMPPFGRLAALILSGPDLAQVQAAAATLAAHQPRHEGLAIYGPAPAPLAMLRGRHRMRFLVHATRRAPLHAAVRSWLAAVRLPSAVRVTIDVDPQSFL